MDLQAMIVAIYARVSTLDQSCEMQLHELRQYVAKQGWQVFQEYVDTGFSGAAASRPRLDQLLRDARLQKFEGVRCLSRAAGEELGDRMGGKGRRHCQHRQRARSDLYVEGLRTFPVDVYDATCLWESGPPGVRAHLLHLGECEKVDPLSRWSAFRARWD